MTGTNSHSQKATVRIVGKTFSVLLSLSLLETFVLSEGIKSGLHTAFGGNPKEIKVEKLGEFTRVWAEYANYTDMPPVIDDAEVYDKVFRALQEAFALPTVDSPRIGRAGMAFEVWNNSNTHHEEFIQNNGPSVAHRPKAVHPVEPPYILVQRSPYRNMQRIQRNLMTPERRAMEAWELSRSPVLIVCLVLLFLSLYLPISPLVILLIAFLTGAIRVAMRYR